MAPGHRRRGVDDVRLKVRKLSKHWERSVVDMSASAPGVLASALPSPSAVVIELLTAYAPHPDPLYYTQCIIDGLRDDIKSAVLVQRPSTLDSAFVLAQLQEVSGAAKRPF